MVAQAKPWMRLKGSRIVVEWKTLVSCMEEVLLRRISEFVLHAHLKAVVRRNPSMVNWHLLVEWDLIV